MDNKKQFPCRKSSVQEYQCCISAKKHWKSEREWLAVDACLIRELFYLWDMGIITTGCCCGNHENAKKDVSYIGVKDEFIPKMKELGYQVRFNPCRPNDEDSFIPKTKL